jgi:uncharacterized protein YhaN
MEIDGSTYKYRLMHINALHIDGFGIFNDFELGGFDKGINLVVGANEAGKSTLLQFFRYTLFGYPRSVENRMAPLQGGNHGGRITAVLQDGKKVTFERMSGASGGNIRLVHPHRESTSQDEWQLLLGQASARMYENIYAFTLDELVGFDKLRESGIRDRLFSVQLGLGEVSLNDVSATLTNASEAIYKARGSVQLVPNLKNELDDRRQQLQALQAKKGEYEQLQKELTEMSESITAREKETNELQQKIDKREKLLQCYDNYYELMEVREQLQEAPEPLGLDEKLRGEMEALVRDQKNVKAEIEKLEQKQKRKKQALQSTTVDAEILEKEPSIKWLETHLEKYRSTVDALRKLENQLKDDRENIQHELRDIGGDWTVEMVRAFEGYEQKADQAARFQQAFDNLKERKMRLEAQLANRQPAAIDTRKVLFALAALALLAGIGSLVSGLFALGIILIVSGIGLGAYALWGLKV